MSLEVSPGKMVATASSDAVEMMVGPLATLSSGNPSGEYRTVMGCSKYALNHCAASGEPPGKPKVFVEMPPRSVGTESVTELRSGAYAARIRCTAAVRLPLTHCPSPE